MSEHVRLNDAARLLGVSAQHVARLARRGEISYLETPSGGSTRRPTSSSAGRVRRDGRPPTRAPEPEPVAPAPDAVLVVLEEAVTLLDELSQPGSVLEAGRPYLVGAEVARLLIGRGHARGWA